LINQVLDVGEKFAGAAGLEGLLRYNVTLNIGLTSRNVWPGFYLDTATISRLSACGADFGFDPYISDVPDVQCDLNTTNDFTVHFTAMLNPDERVIIAKRPLKKCDSLIEDVYIFQVFKEAWKFHSDNNLRGFRDKQAELKLYARHYTVENCTEDSCRDCNYCILPSFFLSRSAIIRLNAANARFVYQPFTRDQRARG
ncbi:TPA: hypothetical protein HNV15_000490, partial [Shigella dysenteriae]|nr:hypothetical protein [Shigella dysenteriae]HAL0218324.1 hypothetical protein [Shigella dysenteriae]